MRKDFSPAVHAMHNAYANKRRFVAIALQKYITQPVHEL
jgi:hypothetical protein